MEMTMIDSNLLFWLEVCALTVLVGVGIWRIFRTQQSATINVSNPAAYDMRHDGQRFAVQTNSVVEPISAI
jgi:ABC-type nickel/cobalt efflux system permease component RcnA